MTGQTLITPEEIKLHASPGDCWLVVDGNVWDLSEFAPKHPGGADVIYKHAGCDATEAYNAIHSPSLIASTLPASKLVGKLSEVSTTTGCLKPPPRGAPHLTHYQKPLLHTLLSTHDFESVASKTLPPKAWAFYSSAATDLLTLSSNRSFFSRIWFRPRVLRNVAAVDTRMSILGREVSIPLFVAPCAMARLVNEEGEKGIVAACGRKGIAMCRLILPRHPPPSRFHHHEREIDLSGLSIGSSQTAALLTRHQISTNASFPLTSIVSSAPPATSLFFQLYVSKNRRASEQLLSLCHAHGIHAIFVTIDAPVAGKREADERLSADESLSTPMSGAVARNDSKGGGYGRIMGRYIDASLSWEDLAWLKRTTKLPIVLKGVQSAADAALAAEYGVQGIVISNHGGRSLDTSPPSILTLLELHKACPHVFDSLEVYLDSGIRRGTDILKALCLGATAVGVGRPFLYALNYGQAGVEHLIDMLQDELATSMRMIGITNVNEAHPGLVNTLELDPIVPNREDHPYARWRPSLTARGGNGLASSKL